MAPWKRAGSRNRSDIEICADILRVLTTGAVPKTHVMYRANLSYGMLNAYLDLLINADLIEKMEAGSAVRKDPELRGHYDSVYVLTSKGMTVVQKLKPIEEIMGLLELKRQKEALVQ